jgi:hypothetical protein
MRLGGLVVAMLCGCPGAAEPGDTEGDTEAMDPTGGTACTPGTSLDCACSNGSMGMQVCAADGASYGECECAGADTGATGTSSPTTTSPTGSPTGDPSTDPSTETGSSESSGSGESSAMEESTSASECSPGETMECECGQGPGFAACMVDRYVHSSGPASAVRDPIRSWRATCATARRGTAIAATS